MFLARIHLQPSPWGPGACRRCRGTTTPPRRRHRPRTTTPPTARTSSTTACSRSTPPPPPPPTGTYTHAAPISEFQSPARDKVRFASPIEKETGTARRSRTSSAAKLSALHVARGYEDFVSCPATRAQASSARWLRVGWLLASLRRAGRGTSHQSSGRAHTCVMRGRAAALVWNWSSRAREAGLAGGTGAGTAAHRLDLDRTALPRRARTCPRAGLHGGTKKKREEVDISMLRTGHGHVLRLGTLITLVINNYYYKSSRRLICPCSLPFFIGFYCARRATVTCPSPTPLVLIDRSVLFRSGTPRITSRT
jgi:hypothetical protein